MVSLNEAWEQDAYEMVEVVDAGDDYWCVSAFRRGKVLRHEWFASRAEPLEAAAL